MLEGLITTAYIISAILFIMSLAGLSNQETARPGVYYGMTGMALALVATIANPAVDSYFPIIIAMIIGAAIGITVAKKVAMTEMPELVAILHSFVGLAAVMVGFNSHFEHGELMGAALKVHQVEIYLGVFIGAVTFTGSIIAFGKLRGSVSSNPLTIPHRHLINLALVVISVIMMVYYVAVGHGAGPVVALVLMTLIAFFLGWHMIMAIGGADMPVVISMLNSYSGWAAAAAGFMLDNDLLIVTGALVGSSGAILSYIMCRAMNRSFVSVIAGGFGSDGAVIAGGEAQEQGEIQEINAEDLAVMLKESEEVIITPGYGMAVAQAQHTVFEIMNKLKAKGVNVRFAIHPVAGRLPGHMDVLLAEAKVPYDVVLEMDEIDDDFKKTNTVLVIGANDTVNPSANTDPNSPIAGMPVMSVWEAENVIVFKRSMNAGYAGVQNPLFFHENTHMIFGDAKDTCEKILQAI
jgi:H+-translocating NAD(P) transhydrogenase subunit beta